MRRRRIRSGNAGRTWTISRSRRDRVWITWRLQNENLAQFSLGSPSGSSSVDSFQNIGRTLYATSELAASLVAPSCSRCWLAADAFEKLRYSKVIYPFVAATFLPINLPREEEEGTKVYLYVCACMCVCVYVYVSMKCLTACVNSRVRGQPSEEGSREASFIQRGKDMVSKKGE